LRKDSHCRNSTPQTNPGLKAFSLFKDPASALSLSTDFRLSVFSSILQCLCMLSSRSVSTCHFCQTPLAFSPSHGYLFSPPPSQTPYFTSLLFQTPVSHVVLFTDYSFPFAETARFLCVFLIRPDQHALFVIHILALHIPLSMYASPQTPGFVWLFSTDSSLHLPRLLFPFAPSLAFRFSFFFLFA
jgi:hypothetical protein